MSTFRVTFRMPDGSAPAVDVGEDEHVLDAALAAGLELPYSCLQGWCLTCAARVTSGVVDQRDSRRYYAADREAGFALICTGRPRSDLVVEPFARDAMRRERDRRHLPYPHGDWGA